MYWHGSQDNEHEFRCWVGQTKAVDPALHLAGWDYQRETFRSPEVFCGYCQFIRSTRAGCQFFRCLAHVVPGEVIDEADRVESESTHEGNVENEVENAEPREEIELPPEVLPAPLERNPPGEAIPLVPGAEIVEPPVEGDLREYGPPPEAEAEEPQRGGEPRARNNPYDDRLVGADA